MARASTRTLLPLDRFAKVAGISPLHFNQVLDNALDPIQDRELAPATTCGEPVLQYAWQGADRVGREEIARAIADAETQLTSWLGFAPAPKWEVDERVNVRRPTSPTAFNWSGGDVRRFWAAIQLDKGYVLSGGVEAWSLIQAGVAVVYSDLDGDNYKETATMAVVTSVTTPDEISISYPGMIAAGDYAWEVRPIAVSIVAGTAIITCRREQLVKLSFTEGLVAQIADGQDDADFLATVDVYRHYNDPSQQVSLLWLQGWCGCSGGSCAQCEGVSQAACLMVNDERRALVAPQPGTWDAVSGTFTPAYLTECRQADRARVWYRAGWRDKSLAMPTVQMDPQWERAITYLALSLLDRPLCACDATRAYTAYWSEDMAATSSSPSGGTQTFRLSDKLLDTPLGTTRAAIFAWRLVSQHRLGEAVSNL